MAKEALLERDEALDTIRQALTRSVDGNGATVLVAGDAGIGKTALMDASMPIAEALGLRVLRSRASELDRRFGFGVTRQLLEPVIDRLEGPEREQAFAGAAAGSSVLFDRDAPVDLPDEPEYAVLHGLFRLIANLAESQPLLLAIDDVQWADVPTVRALEFLTRRFERLPVALLVTERSAAVPAPPAELDAIRTDPETVRIELRPLSRCASGVIVARAIGHEPDEAFLDSVWTAVDGNPLLLRLACREIVTHDLHGDRVDSDRLTRLVAPGLAPIVLGRLRGLDPEANRLAVAAAVLGERARFDDLTALTELPPERARDGLNQLADAQILAPGGTRYVHELVRAAVLAAESPSELDRLHRAAARRLRSRNAPVGEIALHRFAATPAADGEAVADLHRAAREARREGAVSVAIDLLRRALDEGVDDRERRRELLVDLGELEMRTLSPRGPDRMREALSLGADGEERSRAQAALGQMLILNDPAAALTEIEAARAETRDPKLNLRLEASELECLLFIDGFAERRDERYRQIVSAPSLTVVGLAHRAIHEALTGAPAAEVRASAEEALRDDSLVNRIGPGGPTWNLLSHSLRWAEAAEPAWQVLSRGEEVVREGGLGAAGTFVEHAHVYWHLEMGSAERALDHAEAGLEAVRGSDVAISEAALAAALAESLVLLDRAGEAAERTEGVLERADGTIVEAFCLAARGLVRARTGRRKAARKDLRRAVEMGDRRGWRSPRITRARMRLAELLAADGERDAALDAISPDVDAATRIGSPGTLGAVLRVRAGALDGDDRIQSLEEAVALLARSPLVHDLARARLELGRELLARKQRAAARDILRDGLDGASRAGSPALARELRSELAAAGGRPRRERRRGPDALTPSERRTAELAARGLSNREVAETLWVTRKTVEFHLRNVYAKLGISSRTDLSGALETTQTPG